MKRMVIIAGLVVSLVACAQHDPNSPDTSGNDPQAPNRQMTDSGTNSGSDSSMQGGNSGNNMNNNSTNNNQQINTADSSRQK